MSGAAPADGLPPGRVLGGHYRVEERIGSGAMGVVYRVSHTLLRR